MSNHATASTSSSGIGVIGILGIIFVVCKIFSWGPIATWSWWWVLAPFWIGFLITILILVVVFGLAVWAQSR